MEKICLLQVPVAKKTLEAFICACQDCFKAAGASLTMGNLKHKDLQGQEVASQVPLSCAALPPQCLCVYVKICPVFLQLECPDADEESEAQVSSIKVSVKLHRQAGPLYTYTSLLDHTLLLNA